MCWLKPKQSGPHQILRRQIASFSVMIFMIGAIITIWQRRSWDYEADTFDHNIALAYAGNSGSAEWLADQYHRGTVMAHQSDVIGCTWQKVAMDLKKGKEEDRRTFHIQCDNLSTNDQDIVTMAESRIITRIRNNEKKLRKPQ